MKTLRLVLGLSMAGTLLAAVLAPDPENELVSPLGRIASTPTAPDLAATAAPLPAVGSEVRAVVVLSATPDPKATFNLPVEKVVQITP